MKNSKILPLRPIELKSRPLNHRALAWSSDAELAIAADDSVTIYLPTFPFLDPAQPFPLDDDDNPAVSDKLAQQQQQPPPPPSASAPGPEGENGMGILPANLPANNEGDDDLGSGDEEDDGEDDDDGETGTFADGGSMLGSMQRAEQAHAQEQRQYGDETARVLWVSYPALHPELNLHVWEAAGKAMPLIRSGAGATGDGEGGSSRVLPSVEGRKEGNGEVKHHQEEEEDPLAPEGNAHPGAGTGVIGSAGSSLNHVVAVEWSPSGLGRNQRPVLAVLTGCGSLAVYGEGGPLPFGSNKKPSRVAGRGKTAVRDLQSWLVLWAVGENFVVPGQEEFGYGEYVKAFAWCREVGPGKALLSYMNDLREIVVLCVGTTFRRTEEGLEEAVWNVQEIARMETGGPHGQGDTCDPDYVPSGSSYCLRWSPWAKNEDTWSCLLSYMDRNYVGFKKITINAPTWSPSEAPTLICESTDWDGRCIHLATDAFLEFEDTIWKINNNLICRGIIATPLIAEPFEINLTTPTGPKSSHPTTKCKTTFPPDAFTNPITGLIIHPIPNESTTAPPLTPLYTAVRLSATATNPQWTESNHHQQPSAAQWRTAIQSLIARTVPLGQAGRVGDPTAEADQDGEDGIVRGPDDDNNNNNDDDDDENDDEDSEADDHDPDADFDPWATEGPDVHPYRMRLWGLARSPGGGTTAVLATPLLTQRPMRGAWGAHRSRVLFGWQRRVDEAIINTTTTTTNNNNEEQQQGQEEKEHHANTTTAVDGLTTEARLWEWMYGDAPSIPGLTPSSAAPEPLETTHETQRTRVREICRPLAAAQRCGICDNNNASALKPTIRTGEEEGEGGGGGRRRRVLDAICTQGHRVAVCGVTGLAIMAPGISRACGVCQSRVFRWEEVLERVLQPAGVGEEVVGVVREVMAREVCARCGGKYLD